MPESIDPADNVEDTATNEVDLTQLDDEEFENQAKAFEEERKRRNLAKILPNTRKELIELVNEQEDVSMLTNCINYLAGGVNPLGIGKNSKSGRVVFIKDGKIYSQHKDNKPIKIKGIEYDAAIGNFALIPETTEGFGRGKGVSLDKQVNEIKDLAKELWPEDFEKYEASKKVN